MDDILVVFLSIMTSICIYAFLALFNKILNHACVHPVPAKQLLSRFIGSF